MKSRYEPSYGLQLGIRIKLNKDDSFSCGNIYIYTIQFSWTYSIFYITKRNLNGNLQCSIYLLAVLSPNVYSCHIKQLEYHENMNQIHMLIIIFNFD